MTILTEFIKFPLFSNEAFLYRQGRPLYNWRAMSIDLVKTTILDKYVVRTCARWTEENLGAECGAGGALAQLLACGSFTSPGN